MNWTSYYSYITTHLQQFGLASGLASEVVGIAYPTEVLTPPGGAPAVGLRLGVADGLDGGPRG